MGQWLPGYTRLNDSSHAVMQYLDGTRKTAPDGGMGWIDVEDVARAHVAAMHSGAHGRYICFAISYVATFNRLFNTLQHDAMPCPLTCTDVL
jgi:nucleoside-diphosphate-sugar epimerase